MSCVIFFSIHCPHFAFFKTKMYSVCLQLCSFQLWKKCCSRIKAQISHPAHRDHIQTLDIQIMFLKQTWAFFASEEQFLITTVSSLPYWLILASRCFRCKSSLNDNTRLHFSTCLSMCALLANLAILMLMSPYIPCVVIFLISHDKRCLNQWIPNFCL